MGEVCSQNADPEPGNGHHYYLEDYNFFKYVLEPYLRGEFADLHEARKRMFGASPWFFAEDYLDYVQVHHGMLDTLARPAQTLVLKILLGDVPDNTEFRFYEEANHTIDLIDEDNYYYENYEDATGGWLQAIIDGN